MTRMTFEAFQATGRDVPDINAAMGCEVCFADDGEMPVVKAGRVYCHPFVDEAAPQSSTPNSCYIEVDDGHWWYCLVYNEDCATSDLEQAELFLYEHI